MIRVDYAIIGGGIAGITLKHFLKNDRTVLLDPEPGRYKIGESIIPEQFRHADLHALLPRLRATPSYSPKHGTTFIEAGSVASFPLPPGALDGAMHIARTDMEHVMLDAWNIEPRIERVVGVDLERRRLRTDVNEYEVAEQIIDCSGPAMVLSGLLGKTRRLWPVFATWAYWDIESNQPESFYDSLRAKGWSQLSYNYGQRCVLPDESRDWRPGRSTILTKIRDGVWTWQIPLFRERLLSYGVVSRHGAISRAEYTEIARTNVAPNYTLEMRPLDSSGPYNRVHVRNNFARASDVAATDRMILLSDAFAFADPVYSVGTGLAVNKAIEVATILNETGWSPTICETYCKRYERLLDAAIAGFEYWYAGRMLQDATAASIVQDELLVGNAFQSNIIWHYVQALAAADLPTGLYDADPFAVDWQDPVLDHASTNLTAAIRILLGRTIEENGSGLRLIRACPAKAGVLMKWRPSIGPDVLVLVASAGANQKNAYRRVDGLGVSYLADHGAQAEEQKRATSLIDAMLPVMSDRHADWQDLVSRVSGARR